MTDRSWPAFCASMVADLEAELPIAPAAKKAAIRRAIARWKRDAKQPVREAEPETKRPKSRPAIAWRLGAAR